ncbi:MAG: hypothetical protein ACOCYE_10060 [Pseudomonadota bacterium]
MIAAAPPYVALTASLPALGPLLSAKAPPINQPSLEHRLRALSPEDQRDLMALRDVLSWTRLATTESDKAFLARARRVEAGLRSEALRGVLRDRLEIRTVVAALRRRQAGEDAPPVGEAWGYGRFVEVIRANWGAADLGVGRSFPWVVPAREKLDAGDRKGFERIVLEAAWAAGIRRLDGHHFDFEAVVRYVLQWSLVDRWARYDEDTATERFGELLDAALTDLPQHMAKA